MHLHKISIMKPIFSSQSYKLATIFLVVVVVSQCLVPAKGVSSGHHLGNQTDHAALLAIKSQLVDHPNGGVFSSWNSSLHHCYWDGVTCGLKHNRVIGLDLSSRGLVGTMSPFIGNLSFLQEVELYNNSLVGQIPPEFGRLVKLQALRLHNNSLVGEIPLNLSACVNLQKLAVDFNKLMGKLPLELRALSKLKGLSVYQNSFTGPVFETISNLTSLQLISAGDNAFTGSIPEGIGKMQHLVVFIVGVNEFTGTVPTSILNCSSLEVLDVSFNNLHGEFPRNVGLLLPRLTDLRSSSNHFSGAFPDSVLNLTSMEYLALDTNNFAGKVDLDFGRFHNLWWLDLSFNHLQGNFNFISTLVNNTKLKYLDVGVNEFTGTLPESVANLSLNLRQLFIDKNRITGEIPIGLTKLIKLESLALSGNELTGTMPNDLGKLQFLGLLYLNQNRLTGSIPDTFKNLSRLSYLSLDNNQLRGSIPRSLPGCKSLLELDLSFNHLNDGLLELFEGSALFIKVDLSNNLLEGSIPQEISRQINLVHLFVSENKLSGDIPDGLGDCFALQTLDIHGNFLQGVIPSSFKSLDCLQYVDISRNNLSGTIPTYFSQISLQFLNLSYNNFRGEVPAKGVFTNISEIAIDGNNNLCGGIPKLHLQRCIQRKGIKKRRKFSHALKLIVPIVCALFGLLLLITLLYLTYHRKERVPTSVDSTRKTFMKVSYDILLKATNNFSSNNLVGAGSFGSVFKGNLDGKMVAVKVINLQTRGATKSFMAECKALRNIRHRNLVGVITACSSINFQGNYFKALVYEFMPNGSLDKWLHGNGVEKLTLIQRFDIAIDVAHALSYLHNDCEIPVVHCDLKPSNVLLDNDMVAHVGDFGLTRFLSQPRHPNHSSSIGILGTIGYVAPEYGLGSEASKDGDVYSYGILLLELMTGKRPSDTMFSGSYNLQMYAEEALLADNVLQIVDPNLEENEIREDVDNVRTVRVDANKRVECMVSMISIGIACSKHLPHDRIKISDATTMLQVAIDRLRGARHRRQFQI